MTSTAGTAAQLPGSQKVFCVGFQKTGTSSIATAFASLGYRVTGPNRIQDPRIEQNVEGLVRRLVPRFDVFQDNPWPIVFRMLDRDYPDSRFILTERDPQSWLRSQTKHFPSFKHHPMLRWIYGVDGAVGNEDVILKTYFDHNAAVEEHFASRPHQLLRIDVTQGDPWHQIGEFLEIPVPTTPFPHSNSQSERKARDQSRTRVALRRIKNKFVDQKW